MYEYENNYISFDSPGKFAEFNADNYDDLRNLLL